MAPVELVRKAESQARSRVLQSVEMCPLQLICSPRISEGDFIFPHKYHFLACCLEWESLQMVLTEGTWGEIIQPCVLRRGENTSTYRKMVAMWHWRWKLEWCVYNSRMSRTASSHRSQERRLDQILPQRCPYPNFRLLASRAEREHISIAWSH